MPKTYPFPFNSLRAFFRAAMGFVHRKNAAQFESAPNTCTYAVGNQQWMSDPSVWNGKVC